MAFENAILRFRVRLFGLKGVRRKLKAMTKETKKGLKPFARRITVDLLSFVDKRFAQSARGNPPKIWRRLAQITRFVRAKRAKAKNRNPKILVDKGILRAFNLPFVKSGGKTFGIENRLPYASLQNFGGLSSASSVALGSFRRRKPSGGTTRVKAYTIRFRGGKRVPARPFFPNLRQTLDIVKRHLTDYEKRIANA
ncbi:MAG: hypothetical protein V3T23_03995 [Nitrososphaerales archaeon]